MNYHHRPERVPPGEELIDFACSESWLAYYFERGLTRRHPVVSSDRVASLERRLERLEGGRETPAPHQAWPQPRPMTRLYPLPPEPPRKTKSTGIES